MDKFVDDDFLPSPESLAHLITPDVWTQEREKTCILFYPGQNPTFVREGLTYEGKDTG